ncbi:MAG: hypothetical protein Q7R76_01135 [Candidatus Woesearchaeota archaeon]|nr:hypothetical protein [Candidatus Woesearchaeota archaeon]
MLQKKGQVTFFIILGILLLISVAFMLYFSREKLLAGVGDEKNIPTEFKSIHTFVQQCLDEQALQGIMLLGSQGGFISVPPRIAINPKSFLSLTPAGDLKMPLWYFAGENRAPTIGFMQTELSTFITRQMETCLKGLNAEEFTRAFTFSFPATMSAETSIGTDAVAVKFTYPLTATTGGQTFTFSTFGSRLDVKLGTIAQLAKDIFFSEDQKLFLEDLTMELMTLGSGRPPDDIPFTDVLFTCDKPQWSRKAVLNTLQNRLYHNLPRIRVSNTATPPIPRDDPYARNHFEWKVSEKNYRDLSVGVTFRKDWPFDFRVTPSVGDVMQASFGRGAREYLKYLCVSAYHFTYTLQYPLMFTIIDDKAFNGAGYVFRFALPVIIDHNQGERRNLDTSVFTVFERDREVCNDREEEPFAIYTFDNESGVYINGANMSFDCVNLFSCPLGRTDQVGGIARLSTLLPKFCTPGSVVVEHEDYVTTKQQLDRSQQSVDVNLLPVRHLPVSVVKRTITQKQVNKEENLHSGETALVFITTKDVTAFSSVTRFPLDGKKLAEDLGDAGVGRLGTVDIINANGITYDVTLALLDGNDELIGRLEMNWTPSKRDIKSGTGVKFTVLEYVPHPATMIDQAKMIEDTSAPAHTSKAVPHFTT